MVSASIVFFQVLHLVELVGQFSTANFICLSLLIFYNVWRHFDLIVVKMNEIWKVGLYFSFNRFTYKFFHSRISFPGYLFNFFH